MKVNKVGGVVDLEENPPGNGENQNAAYSKEGKCRLITVDFIFIIRLPTKTSLDTIYNERSIETDSRR
jgi:hypothetical protein